MFSIDCKLNSNPVNVVNEKLKVEAVFKMNQDEVAKFLLDYPVSKITLEESYLVGHIGKTVNHKCFDNKSFVSKAFAWKSLKIGYELQITT